MTNDATGGVSKRSLILLGGLAALALNRDVRRHLVLGTRSALDNAQSTLDDTLKPALSTAAQQAQHAASLAAQQAGQVASAAAHQAGNTWETLRDEGPGRAQTLLGAAQEVLGTLAASAADRAAHLKDDAASAAEQARKEYAPKIAALTSDARDAADQARKTYASKLADLSDSVLDAADDRRAQARKALRQARKQGLAALADLGERAGGLVDEASDSLDDHRRDAARAIARARRDAEKELRRGKKNWNARKLERAIEKRIAPVHKEVQREFVRLEKQVGKKGRKLQASLRPAPKRGPAIGGSAATAVVLLGTGAVVLARVPAARQGILKAVEGFSPEAAEKLHQASRQARNLIGDMWLEEATEPKAPAPGAAPATQAATTGASAAAVVEPGSSAAAKPEVKTDKTDQPKTN